MSPERFRRMHDRATFGGLIVTTGVSGALSFQGLLILSEDDPTVYGRIMLLVFSAGIAVASFGFASLAIRVVPRMPSARLMAAGLLIATAGFSTATAYSAWLNVVATAGPPAFRSHMSAFLAEAGDAVVRVAADARAAGELEPGLRLAAAQLGRREALEIASGAITGYPGAGPVSTAFGEAKMALNGLADALRARVDQIEGLAADARGQLTILRETARSDAPARQRMESIARDSGQLAAVLAHIDTLDLAGLVARNLSQLSRSLPSPVGSRGNTGLTEAQRDALPQVRRLVADVVGPIREAAERIGGETPNEIPRFERIGAVAAVTRYFWDVVPHWVGGVSIDLFGFLLLLLYALVHAASRGTEGYGRLGDTTLEAMIRGEKAKRLLAQSAAAGILAVPAHGDISKGMNIAGRGVSDDEPWDDG